METRVDVDELRRLVEVEGLSQRACAAVLGVSATTVHRVAHHHGIVSTHPQAHLRPELRDPEWLREQSSRTVPEVAEVLGVHPVTVTDARRRYGIAPTRAPRRPINVDEVRRRLEAGQTPAGEPLPYQWCLFLSSATRRPIHRPRRHRSGVCRREGCDARSSNFGVVWGAARTTVGREDLHFHDLRHFANTLAAAAGASTKELMARLGHSSPAAALRYQHATKERDRKIADRMNELLPCPTVSDQCHEGGDVVHLREVAGA